MKRRFLCVVLCIILILGGCAKNVPDSNESRGISKAESNNITASETTSLQSNSKISSAESVNSNVTSQTNSKTPISSTSPDSALSSGEIEAEKVVKTISIMSFNIWVGEWSSREASVTDFINRSGCDIICLQEVKPTSYEGIKSNLSTNYDIVFHDRGDSEGLATIYNKNIFSIESINVFWLSETPEVLSISWDSACYRICENITLKHTASGKSVNVFNIHFDHVSELARDKSAELVTQRANLTEYPSIIAGDFNTQIFSTCLNTLSDGNYKTCQTAYDSDFGTTSHGFGSISDTQGSAIDHIFISKNNMKATKFEICRDRGEGGIYLSDHYPVRATIEIAF